MTRRLQDCGQCDGKTRHANRVCAPCRETAEILADPDAMAAIAEAQS